MKADEYTPLEHTYGNYIEAVQAGTVSTFSARYTRALHLGFNIQSISMFCVLVNHHHSNIQCSLS